MFITVRISPKHEKGVAFYKFILTGYIRSGIIFSIILPRIIMNAKNDNDLLKIEVL